MGLKSTNGHLQNAQNKEHTGPTLLLGMGNASFTAIRQGTKLEKRPRTSCGPPTFTAACRHTMRRQNHNSNSMFIFTNKCVFTAHYMHLTRMSCGVGIWAKVWVATTGPDKCDALAGHRRETCQRLCTEKPLCQGRAKMLFCDKSIHIMPTRRKKSRLKDTAMR